MNQASQSDLWISNLWTRGVGRMSNFNQQSVLSVHHWTDTLFSFTTTRDPSAGAWPRRRAPNYLGCRDSGRAAGSQAAGAQYKASRWPSTISSVDIFEATASRKLA